MSLQIPGTHKRQFVSSEHLLRTPKSEESRPPHHNSTRCFLQFLVQAPLIAHPRQLHGPTGWDSGGDGDPFLLLPRLRCHFCHGNQCFHGPTAHNQCSQCPPSTSIPAPHSSQVRLLAGGVSRTLARLLVPPSSQKLIGRIATSPGSFLDHTRRTIHPPLTSPISTFLPSPKSSSAESRVYSVDRVRRPTTDVEAPVVSLRSLFPNGLSRFRKPSATTHAHTFPLTLKETLDRLDATPDPVHASGRRRLPRRATRHRGWMATGS